MPSEAKFNPICMQLIRTPASSRQVLESAPRGVQPAVPEGATFPVEAARRWAAFVLAEPYRPAAATPFVPFENESNVCDVVRALFKTEEFPEIELAQTEYLCTVRVRQKTARDPDPAKMAAGVAKKVFGIAEPVSFEVSGRFFTGVYGRRQRALESMPTPVPSWFDAFNWWQENRDVGFLMIKYSGTPMRESIGPEQIYNPNWFGKD